MERLFWIDRRCEDPQKLIFDMLWGLCELLSTFCKEKHATVGEVVFHREQYANGRIGGEAKRINPLPT